MAIDRQPAQRHDRTLGIGRYFARWLSAIPLLLGYFWMLWDPKKQTWHDKLVSTIVVKG